MWRLDLSQLLDEGRLRTGDVSGNAPRYRWIRQDGSALSKARVSEDILVIKRLMDLLFLLLLGVITASTARAEIVWHWQDHFNAQEQRKLQTWIKRTVSAVETLVSPYPFDVHIYFYRMPGRGEPVPWANTRRHYQQGVNFHVDPSYRLESFLKDWTAPHELSHLLIPSVGNRYSWFAEGFASYMQYQVMRELGVLNHNQIAKKYQRHINRAYENYPFHSLPFDRAARELRRRRDFPRLYWGGAVYFLKSDHELQQLNSSLLEVLSHYVACCRTSPTTLAGLVSRLDELSGTQIFSSQLRAIESEKGFPTFAGILPSS